MQTAELNCESKLQRDLIDVIEPYQNVEVGCPIIVYGLHSRWGTLWRMTSFSFLIQLDFPLEIVRCLVLPV